MKPIDTIVVMLFLAAFPGVCPCGAQTGGKATVSGAVTDAVTGLPVQGAVVTSGMSVMRTDSSGTYTIHIPPGKTRILAFRAGYTKPEPASLVEVHEGEAIRKDFVLRPAPRISGIVTDAATGQRIHGCIVFATRRISALGEAWFVPAGLPTADGRDGSFEIMGLDPGSYILEITGCQWSYYPGVDRIEMASPLALTEAGIAGLTVKLDTHSGHRIAGVIEGRASNLDLVRVVQGDSRIIAQTRPEPSGEFTFENVPEGEYSLVASAHLAQVVEVTDHDLTGIPVKTQFPAAPQLSVKMLEDGEKEPPKLRAGLFPAVTGDPVLRWPRVTGLPDGYAVSSVLADDIPVPNGSLSTAGINRVTFVITSRVGTLTGTAAPPHALVFAVREPFNGPLDQSSLPRSGSDESGAYTIDNLAPGKYKVFTLSGEEELLQHNEQFLRRKAEAAESVEIEAGSITQADLK